MVDFINFDGWKDKSAARVEIDALGGTGSFRSRFYQTPEGDAELRTKNGMPQVTITPKTTTVTTTGKVLDFLSGVVFGGWLSDGAVSSYFPRSASASKFSLKVGVPYAIPRLAVALNPSVGIPSLGGSQYSDLRASFYSGKMRALVQFVLGIGFVKHPSWYAINETLPDYVFSSYLDAQPVPVEYGYSFGSTHGVAFGADGEPWLIHISQAQGVWAFLLPREFGTHTDAFGESIEDDAEGVAVWSMFKGFPTGECPAPSEFVSWQKSGCGFQLLRPDQMLRYTESIALSSQLGWAFNYTGTEARVVGIKNILAAGVDYYENSYLGLTFTIPESRSRNTSTTARSNAAKYAATVRARAWLRCKLDYMSEAQATTLSGLGGSAALSWLEALDVAPISEPSAVFSVLETSPLNIPSSGFKVWNPVLEICASLALSVIGTPSQPDEVMLNVFFSEAGLVETRWVKGSGGLTSGVVTTLHSSQAPVASSYTSTSEWVSSVFGPKSITLKMYLDSVLEYFEKDWWVQNSRTVITRSDVTGLSSGFIPYGDREAVMLATLTTDGGGESSKSYVNTVVQDSRSYVAATMFIGGETIEKGTPVTAYGCTLPYNQDVFVRNDDLVRDGWGYPVNNGHGELTWPLEPNRYDGGAWASPCEAVVAQSWTEPAFPVTPPSSIAPQGTFEVVLISGGVVFSVISDADTPSQIHYKYDVWFKPSSPNSDPQTLRAASNCLGPATTYQCYNDINSGSYKVFGDVVHPQVLNSNPCYIGVV